MHATEPSNASRTLLFDIDTLDWSPDLLELFGVPRSCLGAVLPSSGRFGTSVPACAAGLAVPVSGIAGDQQAALFGQACFTPGMTKNTYGTGSFVLVNLGASHPPPSEGLLTTVAWTLGDDVTYALEGSIFITGAAMQWLRDGLGIIDAASEVEPLAASVPDTGDVVFVPAFTGLGSPYWDPYARGALLGLTRGTTRAHIARAAIEAMAWQTADVVDAIARGCRRVDHRAARRRRRERDEPALSVPGRRARRAGAKTPGARDHRTRRRVPRGHRRRRVAVAGRRRERVAGGRRVHARARRRPRPPPQAVAPRRRPLPRLGDRRLNRLGSAELGEGAADAADRLPDAVLVLDEREPHESFTAGAEADTG